MPTLQRSFLLLLAAAAALGLSAFAGPQSGPDREAVRRAVEQGLPRVVLRIDRHTEIMGYVELEDDEVIVVRTLRGELSSYPLARVSTIIRLVDPQPGQTGIVVLRSGQIREGTIIEDVFEHVLIEIEGVRAKLKRETVDYVVLEPTVMERYRQYKATLRPELAQRHLGLCKWLVDEEQLELAKVELDELLSRHNLPEAHQLRTLVEAQLELIREREARRNRSEDPDEVESDPRPGAGEQLDRTQPEYILTRDDVNLIRVYELDFRRPPKVAISRATIGKLIDQYATDKRLPASQTEREKLYRAEPLEIVELMFNLRARELYPEIEVLSEPYALNLFRQRVHNTWLMHGCATSRCHGGTEAGRLRLHQRKHKDARVRYANLLILERLEIDPDWPLINYQNPMDSLIIQHGLPRESSRRPHPEVPGWKPAFRKSTDRLVTETVAWIEAMLRPRPEYPVEYEPPVPEPAPPDEATTETNTGDGRTAR